MHPEIAKLKTEQLAEIAKIEADHRMMLSKLKKRFTVFIVLVGIAFFWLAILSWSALKNSDTLNLHEFWIREALSMVK